MSCPWSVEADHLTDPGLTVVKNDPWLFPHRGHFYHRQHLLEHTMDTIEQNFGSIEAFAQSYKNFGFHKHADGGYVYHEWAPNVSRLCVYGDFNQWKLYEFEGEVNSYGHWTVRIPASVQIPKYSTIKIHIEFKNPTNGVLSADRLPQYTFATNQPDGQPTIDSVFWCPEMAEYQMQHPKPSKPKTLRIYEAHVGMATEKPRVGTYREFADNVIPYIADSGYNAVQLMAVPEHSYYACFGYQVTSFFAVASRCGTPDDFRYLVDRAHEHNLVILLDICHSHASKNELDGVSNWDGSEAHLFHAGSRGVHPSWDSRCFNFGNIETLRFLLSNIAYWLDVFCVDGFRFDAIGSMLYHHRGVGVGFTGEYEAYFGNKSVDYECVTYLQLVHLLLEKMAPKTITIAEDVSGIPTLCRPVHEGGIGFSYRLALALPDVWIKNLKEYRDEDWDMEHLCWSFTNQRAGEPVVAYAESHDQALVGDKTISFWLMDKEMYSGMSILAEETEIIKRGISLHKLIKLLTMGLGGRAWMTFMGNEFGHPEYIDFPREGNGWSFHYCRRQWSLIRGKDAGLLRYQHLGHFDSALMHLEGRTNFLAGSTYVLVKNNHDKLIVFEKNDGNLLFVVNFHGWKTYEDYGVAVHAAPGTHYRMVLDSDIIAMGGRNDDPSGHRELCVFPPSANQNGEGDGHFPGGGSVLLRVAPRTAVVYEKVVE